MSDRQGINSLRNLYKIVEAGEKGYAVAAVNVKNRGLKVLFKAYAQQRARFKAEIRAELRRLDADIRQGGSVIARIHRGRMNIFATLIVESEGREKMLLKEIMIGEGAALSSFERSLKHEMSAETRTLLECQYKQIAGVVEQVQHILGKNGKRQVVHLYNSEDDVEKIVQSLDQAGFPAETVERISLGDMAELYKGKGSTVSDAILSGAVGGVLWGSVIGSVAGLGAVQTSGVDPLLLFPAPTVWGFIALAGIAGGAIVGAILGFFIGLGASEEDAYQYNQSMKHGHTIVRISIDEARAREAGQILAQGYQGANALHS